MKQKSEKFLRERHAKLAKQAHAFKFHASSYNVQLLNSFSPELHPKDTESTIRNKLIDLLSEIKDFKFVTTDF